MNREHLGRKCATVAAAVVVAFLCGGSATGLTGGVVFAVALGAGVAVTVFSDQAKGHCSCLFWRRSR